LTNLFCGAFANSPFVKQSVDVYFMVSYTCFFYRLFPLLAWPTNQLDFQITPALYLSSFFVELVKEAYRSLVWSFNPSIPCLSNLSSHL
jgi:hypothetical protein